MLAYSSELYKIETKDISILPDAEVKEFLPNDEIIIKIGNNTNYKNRTISKDALIKGREKVEFARKKNRKYIKVRIAFEPGNKWYDFISPLIRVLRYKIRTYGSNTYHMTPQFIRKSKLERSIRTRENAYAFTKPEYRMTEKERRKEYNKLYYSMKKHKFDDRHPLDIMVCRNMGVKDTLNNGHHRMAVAMDLHLNRVAVIFSSAGAAPRCLHWLFMQIAKMNMFFKHVFNI